MARIPTDQAVSPPVSFRPSGAVSVADTSGLSEGIDALARGVAHLGAGVGQRDQVLKNRQNVSEVAAAEAEWLKGSLDIGNRFQSDGNYATFDQRATMDSTKLRDAAAAKITDPETRQRWLDEAELKRISLVDAVNDRGTELKHEAQRVGFEDALKVNSAMISEPSVPSAVRDKARSDLDTSIKMASSSGLLTPSEAAAVKVTYLDGADEQLAINRANLNIRINPQQVLADLAVPTESTDSTLVAAQMTANGGKLPDLDPAMAKMTADLLGDANFPDDPKLAKAYLSDPEKAAQYAEASVTMLSDRYKGDLTAVVIASDPQGGTALADRWVSSKHDESVLPAGVRDRYRSTMQAYQPKVPTQRIPIVAAPGIDLGGIDVNVLKQFESLQSTFGERTPLLAGDEKNAALYGRTLTVDLSGLSDDRKAQFVSMASAMGFTGIDVGSSHVRLEAGTEVKIGSTDSAMPKWAKGVADTHAAGTVDEIPVVYAGVSPQYAALSFDQRLKLADQAKAAMNDRDVSMKASIETIAQNAPAAVAQSGTYDGDVPTATQFVQAYGAEAGMAKFKEFTASMDVSKAVYGFRTQSTDDITAAVSAAAPTSNGNDAFLQGQKFAVISKAGLESVTARNEDPAAYTMDVFPAIKQLWTDAGNDPQKRTAALTAMMTAQTKLGIDDPQLLPKQMATDAANVFKDDTKTADERIGAVAGLVLQTSDEGQQKAIYDQLVKAGVPAYTQGAVAAMARGDTAAAQTLMRAALVDPTKMGGKLPVSTEDINAKIQDMVFDDGEVGNIVYGMDSGSPESLSRAAADSTLMERAVKLRLIDGSANGSLDKAVELTKKDLYGDVQTVNGGGVKITLPAGEDPQPMRDGFRAVQPKVKDALQTDMLNGLVQIAGKETDMRETGMGAIYAYGIQNAVDQVMAEGYFTNAGDGNYQFFNPYTGAAIGGADGQPLVFTKADVLAAGKSTAPAGGGSFLGMQQGWAGLHG